jgi:hypothetical protein
VRNAAVHAPRTSQTRVPEWWPAPITAAVRLDLGGEMESPVLKNGPQTIAGSKGQPHPVPRPKYKAARDS